MTEFDLRVRLNKTLRKDLKSNRYEIVDISTGEVFHLSSTLKQTVRIANQFGDSIRIECSENCTRSLRQH
jgi:hypothetical protein